MQGLEADFQAHLTEYKEVLKQQHPLIKEKFSETKKKMQGPKQALAAINEVTC